MIYRFLFLFFFFLTGITYGQNENQYVILISLDGYRHDYTERFEPENIQKLIKSGIKAEGLIPSFPSKTFPNHYTIATGMKPENHGLVDNTFYDSFTNKIYSIGNREAVQDASWYGGTPLWVLAEQYGLTTASYFFVGTEAPVQGIQPTYFYNYDAGVSNLSRIAKVFEWLELPEDERPRLITLYFSDMDDVGHRYGPNNDKELKDKLTTLDLELGALFLGLQSMDLDVNIILVSDHGMTEVPKQNLINLDDITKGLDAQVFNNGALAHIHLNNPLDMETTYLKLSQKDGPFKIEKVSDRNYYRNIEKHGHKLGDLLILPELGFYLATAQDMVKYQNRAAMFDTQVFGEHGYSPEYADMLGIFYAIGPAFEKGLSIARFQNIHIYPMVCQLLGLPIPEGIDGRLEVLEKIIVGRNEED